MRCKCMYKARRGRKRKRRKERRNWWWMIHQLPFTWHPSCQWGELEVVITSGNSLCVCSKSQAWSSPLHPVNTRASRISASADLQEAQLAMEIFTQKRGRSPYFICSALVAIKLRPIYGSFHDGRCKRLRMRSLRQIANWSGPKQTVGVKSCLWFIVIFCVKD